MDYQLNQSQGVQQDRMSWWYVFLLPPAFFYFSLLLVGRIMPFIIVPQSPGAARDMALGSAMGVISYALLDIFLSIGLFIYLLRKRRSTQANYALRKHKKILVVLIVGIALLHSWLFIEETNTFISTIRDIEARVASMKDRSDGISPCMDSEIRIRFNIWSQCIGKTMSAEADYQKCLHAKPMQTTIRWGLFGPSDYDGSKPVDPAVAKKACDAAKAENRALGAFDDTLDVSSCFAGNWPTEFREIQELNSCVYRFVVDRESYEKCVSYVSKTYSRMPISAPKYDFEYVTDICRKEYDSFMKYESSGY